MKFYDSSRLKHLLGLIVLGLILVPSVTLGLNTATTGYRTTTSGVTVSAHGVCKDANQAGSNSYFIPTRTASEWSSFRSNVPSGITLSDPTCVPGTLSKASDLNDNLWGGTAAKVVGNHLYVLTVGSLLIFDVSNANDTVLLGRFNDSNLANAWDIAISGNYAYIASGNYDGVISVNISNKSNPVKAGQISHSSMDNSRGIAVSGNYAYVTGSNADSLTIINITNPASMSRMGSYISATQLNGPYGVAVSGSYAYVAATASNALTVINISNKSNPTFADTITNPNLEYAFDVEIVGNRAYVVAARGNSLNVININNPNNVTALDSVSSSLLSGADDLTVVSGYAYVSARSAGRVTLVNVSDANNVSITGSSLLQSGSDPRGTAVYGNWKHESFNGLTGGRNRHGYQFCGEWLRFNRHSG
jgi:hypothetical protein